MGAGELETRTISVDPLTPVIGAEIGGVDLSQPLGEQQFAEIRAAFIRHHVLVFRDQHLTPEAHKRFAGMFGRLHVHPYHAKNTAPEHARPIRKSSKSRRTRIPATWRARNGTPMSPAMRSRRSARCCIC